jgi:acyl transferase domain-containing protein/NADP-dependent 3-hydroxy acid dehydrogenase YdfG
MVDLDDRGGAGSVAIVGMSGRFPGAATLDRYWANLRAGRDCLVTLSEQELNDAGVGPEVTSDLRYVRRASVLEDIEYFDAGFFGINPREAQTIDPQHRLFLECVWHALEDAGYDPDRYAGSIGVYGGCLPNSYAGHLHRNPHFAEQVGAVAVALGNDRDYLTSRASFRMNLTGPSVNLQAACATGLLAVSQASDALLADRCDMAIAGAVAVRVPQRRGYLYEPDSMFSPDGRCRVFDARARGAVFGNGVGVVVLKRLENALADRDAIRAVLRGTAVTNDGGGKDSFTAPAVAGQRRAVVLAHAAAGVSADEIDYVEAHGTGTAVGDPIEVAALTEAFRAGSDRRGYCALGAVKANVGHLDTAAGIAGLIKVVLALEHEQLPPNINFAEPNPAIDFASSPFYVNTELLPWRRGDRPRRAGVSAFGVGGANVHVVVEEAPLSSRTVDSPTLSLLVTSARSRTALDKVATQLSDHLALHPELAVVDVAHTLQVGRRQHAFRRAVVAVDRTEAVAALRESIDGPDPTPVAPTEDVPIVFTFPGQGSQHVGMGAKLYWHEPTFAAVVDRCAELLMAPLGLDIRELIFAAADERAGAAARLGQTAITQPALFVIEYALAQLWKEWGVEPHAVLGHSVGEYVAATLAGVMALPDALSLTAERARLMQALPGGIMLAVALPESEVRTLLDVHADVAAVNERSATVVAGTVESITALESRLTQQRVSTVRLHTSHAFHSPMTDPVVGTFRDTVAAVRLRAPAAEYVSCVTGTWITPDLAVSPAYWAAHVRRTVRFADGLQTMVDRFGGRCTVLEVGPGRNLTSIAARAGLGRGVTALASLPGPTDDADDRRHLLATLGRLWSGGTRIDWSAGPRARRVALPAYPFERQRYWVEPTDPARPAPVGDRPVKQPDVTDWFSVPRWEPAPISPVTKRARRAAATTQWLVFGAEPGVGADLAAALRRSGAAPIVVRAGTEFRSANYTDFEIDPLAAEHYALLLKTVAAGSGDGLRIVHCWLADRAWPADPPTNGLGAATHELLVLAHALSEVRSGPGDEIAVVARDAYTVTGADGGAADQAAAFGFCTVMAQEFQIAHRLIDLGAARPRAAGRQLLAELLGPRPDAPVAYRDGGRSVRTFEALPLGPTTPPSRRLRARGVYLITGGLGGIGLQLAGHLAETVQARLVLLSRSVLPARGEWQRWQAQHDAAEATSRRISAVLDLERAGGEVRVLTADVTVRAQVADAIRLAHEEFDALHGVIHAAGVAGGGLVALKDADTAAQVMAPKIAGAMVLDELVRDLPLDLVLLCSSVAAVLGGVGQADYCAANAFLDALTQVRRAQGRTAYQVVNWDTWSEVGMAVDTAVAEGLQRGRADWLANGMTTREAIETFERILDSGRPQVMVTTAGPRAALRHAGMLWTTAPSASAAASGSATSYPRPACASTFVAPRSPTESAIAQIWQDLLGIDAVGVNDNFFCDLGGHSLLASQAVGRVWQNLGSDLSVRRFLEVPTVAGLAEAIESGTATVDSSGP